MSPAGRWLGTPSIRTIAPFLSTLAILAAAGLFSMPTPVPSLGPLGGPKYPPPCQGCQADGEEGELINKRFDP